MRNRFRDSGPTEDCAARISTPVRDRSPRSGFRRYPASDGICIGNAHSRRSTDRYHPTDPYRHAFDSTGYGFTASLLLGWISK